MCRSLCLFFCFLFGCLANVANANGGAVVPTVLLSGVRNASA